LDEIKVLVSPETGSTELNIFTGEKKVFYPGGTDYRLDTIDAIAELVKFRGYSDKTLIFFDNKGIGIILDDSIMDRPKDHGKFVFKTSAEWDEWVAVLNKALPQKQFVDFLKLRQPEEVHEMDDLLGKAQYLSYATSIIGDFGYEDRDNITVAIKIKDAETTTKIPRQFEITLPLVFGASEVVDMEISLELQKPREEGQKPLFTLTCPKFNRYWSEAVGWEISRLKELLPGYQILAGSM
jgi:hypothetical protein